MSYKITMWVFILLSFFLALIALRNAKTMPCDSISKHEDGLTYCEKVIENNE